MLWILLGGIAAIIFFGEGEKVRDINVIKFTREEFHKMFLFRARNVEWGGIDPRMALAVADVETGYGNGNVFQQTMNLFSITRGSWTGPVYKAASGLEFRRYNSWDDSMRDFVRLMHASRYSKALAGALAGDFKTFAQELKAAGYDASQPKYAEILEARYNTIGRAA